MVRRRGRIPAARSPTEPWLILAAVVVIYIVLGVLYESWIHPVTILSTLPSAGIGALLALMLCGLDLSLVALVGIVLLMGIVKKNAIMMVDFALEARARAGRCRREDAIREACLLRFRPIMMTTMAALLGALPLAFGHGAGSELRYPAGRHDHRRPAAEPVADAVHDAGDLPGLRAAARRACGRPARGAGRIAALMGFSALFIRRPVATILLAIGLFLSGAVAYQFLPVAALPRSTSRPSSCSPARPAPIPKPWRTPSRRRWSAGWARSPG